jgi:hypothetical protein
MSVFVSYFPLFWVLGDLLGPWHSIHVWELWQKTHRFCILGPSSWAIANSFGFLRWFTRPMTLTTCLRGMSQNSSFLYLWPFSWAIAHSFGVLGWFQGQWHSVHVWEAWPKTHRFCVYGHFRDLCPQFWGSGVIYKTDDTQNMFERHDQKLVILTL